MSTSAGTTAMCQHCGRPIIGTPMRMGGAGDVYHAECTMPPLANQGVMLEKITRALVRRGLAQSYQWNDGLTKEEVDFIDALCDLIDARIEAERNWRS